MANDIVFQQRAADLAEMITRVIREGLEGLVLKDLKVQPGYVSKVILGYCKLHSMLPLKALEMVCYNLHVVRLKAFTHRDKSAHSIHIAKILSGLDIKPCRACPSDKSVIHLSE